MKISLHNENQPYWSTLKMGPIKFVLNSSNEKSKHRRMKTEEMIEHQAKAKSSITLYDKQKSENRSI